MKLINCFEIKKYFVVFLKLTILLYMSNVCDHDRKPIKGVILIQVMTAREYAAKAKISPQAVTAALRRGKPHPGIIAYKRFGHQWKLDVLPEAIKKATK